MSKIAKMINMSKKGFDKNEKICLKGQTCQEFQTCQTRTI